MFQIELFDESGEKLIDKEFALPSLPVLGQKIVLREKGEFKVTELVILIDEYSPNMAKYKVVVKPPKSSSGTTTAWLSNL